MLRKLLKPLFSFLMPVRLLLVGLFTIGLPVFIYLAFIAKEPVFGPEMDVELGRQTARSFAEDPEVTLLSEEQYPEAYAHLRRIVGNLVASPEVGYSDLFAYQDVKIIHDDDVLNAFCAPGGFIYVYTGILHYMDTEDHLAGVLGHEIAHAELRHSSLRLQREFGVERLFEFAVLSSPMTIGNVVNLAILRDLTGLHYSREQEAQADDYSVRYLADSGYACDGTAGFFAKLLEEGDGVGLPAFLSDHPEPGARVRDIRRTAQELGCSTALTSSSSWTDLQESLPPVETNEPG